MKRIIVALVAAPVLALGLAACGGSEAPAPVVTITEQDPAPEPTEEDITQSDGYLLIQAVLEKTWNKQKDPEVICIAWAVQREKWLAKFTEVNLRFGSYEEVNAAVADFFDGKCASDA